MITNLNFHSLVAVRVAALGNSFHGNGMGKWAGHSFWPNTLLHGFWKVSQHSFHLDKLMFLSSKLRGNEVNIVHYLQDDEACSKGPIGS